MELITPGIGLIFWTGLFFTLALVVLYNVGFKTIISAINERHEYIAGALKDADKARHDFENAKTEVEKMLKAARSEKDLILKEASDKANKMIAEAQQTAKEESNRIIASAQEAIQSEKKAALQDIKSQVANISIAIAEKLLEKELASANAQQQLVNEMLQKMQLN